MPEIRRLVLLRLLKTALVKRDVCTDEQQAIVRECHSTTSKKRTPTISALRAALEKRPHLAALADAIIDEACGKKTTGLRARPGRT